MRTLIHIGLPRTASTFLQRQVFPKIQGFDFFGVERTFYSEPFQKLLYQDESLYSFAARKELIESSSDNIFLSNELFCGQSYTMNATNRTRTALRLKKVFPEAEIVLILRNQLSLLESLYSIAVYGGYYKEPEAFIRLGTTELGYNTFSENEHTESYLFSPLIKLYQENFDRVHVFLFEDFVSDPNGFIQNFKSSLGIELNGPIAYTKKENKSLSQRQINYFRRINRAKSLLNSNAMGRAIFLQKMRFGEHILGGKKRFHFSPNLSSQICEFYTEDNLALMDSLSPLKESSNYRKHYSY